MKIYCSIVNLFLEKSTTESKEKSMSLDRKYDSKLYAKGREIISLK